VEIKTNADGSIEYDEDYGVEITLEEGNGFAEGAADENKGYCLSTLRNGLTKVYFRITEIVT
jgi:hypothetical protein